MTITVTIELEGGDSGDAREAVDDFRNAVHEHFGRNYYPGVRLKGYEVKVEPQ